MISVNFGSYYFLVDLIHITFLAGLVVSYLYFRSRQVSVGGSLTVGYLAASLYMPWNVVFTVLVSVAAWLFIQYVVLKIWLPRPRQIFAIGLFVGVLCGALWVMGSQYLFGTQMYGMEFALIGVIVPGMLCNSLVKQGPRRTLLPLAWMVPCAGLIGVGITWLTSVVLPLSFSSVLFEQIPRSEPRVFGLAAASVLCAILIQDGLLKNLRLRTGGYITAGLLVATSTNPRYIAVLAVSALVVWAVYSAYAHRVPLFGKDRFIVLCALSILTVIGIEGLVVTLTSSRVGGAENIIFCILPAIVANDLVQYGWKRTGGGLALSVVACAAIAALASVFLPRYLG